MPKPAQPADSNGGPAAKRPTKIKIPPKQKKIPVRIIILLVNNEVRHTTKKGAFKFLGPFISNLDNASYFSYVILKLNTLFFGSIDLFFRESRPC
jgi:hypothetical protein